MGHYRPVIRMNIVEEPRNISQHLAALHSARHDNKSTHNPQLDDNMTTSYIIHHASSSIVVACSCVSSLACTSTPLATISLLSNSNNSPLDDQTGWFMTVKILMLWKMTVKNVWSRAPYFDSLQTHEIPGARVATFESEYVHVVCIYV